MMYSKPDLKQLVFLSIDSRWRRPPEERAALNGELLMSAVHVLRFVGSLPLSTLQQSHIPLGLQRGKFNYRLGYGYTAIPGFIFYRSNMGPLLR